MGCKEPLNCCGENGKVYGFRLLPSFSALIDEAARITGVPRSDFVRNAIARAVEDAGVSVGSFIVARQGKQTAPRGEVLARAAGARSVRVSKTPGTPENVRRMELLAAGYDEEAVDAYLYAKARAEKSGGRPLTPEEDEEFIASAAARAAEIKACNGGGGE